MTKRIYNENENGGKCMGENIQSNRLKELRKNSKLTQEQMAQYLGVDQSLVTKLENGTRALNVSLIEKICSLFCCTEDYLFGIDDEYTPMTFAFRANCVQADDLESIAAVNRIARNIRYMNSLMEK